MPQNKQAQTGLQNEPANTRCSICRNTDEKVREAINRALAKGISHKDIEAMTGTPSRTVGNHAQHLPAIFREAKQQSILSQAIDVDAELREQLAFAKDMRIAAREYLAHPETGAICLFPRSDEISVIYEDFKDTTATGEPKKKTDTLDILLERVETASVNPTRTIIKHVDIRSFALDAIKTTDLVVDRFAKMQGVYQKERQNEQDFEQAVTFVEYFVKSGVSYEQIDEFISLFPMFSEIDKNKLRSRCEVKQIEGMQ